MRRAVYVAALFGAAVGSYFYGQATSIMPAVTDTVTAAYAAAAPPPTKVEVSPVVIIKAMEEIYETNTFSMRLTAERVKAGRCDGNWYQDLAYRDCLLMQVPATVKAGFDRAMLDRSLLTATSELVTIDLGTPVIHDVIINHAQVLVLNPDDDGGWLTDANKNLQAEGFATAEQKLRIVACRAGIYKSAALSAVTQHGDAVRNLLALAGDHRPVKVVYQLPHC